MPADSLLHQVRQCPNYRTLYALEPSFNAVGLTVQSTGKNRMVLCKLRNGQPLAEEAITDFIFVGDYQDSSREISGDGLNRICEFIIHNQGPSDQVRNVARAWRNGLRMYESSIVIQNEDIHHIAGAIREQGQ